jgi:hypothetical protein
MTAPGKTLAARFPWCARTAGSGSGATAPVVG